MTIVAPVANRIIVTTQVSSIAPTYTHESIEIHGGTLTTGQLRCVLDVIEDLLTSLSNGPIFSDATWETVIMKRRSGWHGPRENSLQPKDWRLESITNLNLRESRLYGEMDERVL